MNEIAKVESLKAELAKRETAMETSEGKKEAAQFMLAVFDYLNCSGYKMPDVDFKKMAYTYAGQLKEYIVTYGYDIVKQAVKEFVCHDTSPYHTMPTAGQLIKEIEAIGGNPRAEIARIELEEFIRQDTERVHRELLKGAKK